MNALEEFAATPLAEFRTWLDENQGCELVDVETKIGELVDKHAPSPEDILAHRNTNLMTIELLNFLSTKYPSSEVAGDLAGKARGLIGFALWDEWRKETNRRRSATS